MGHAGLPFRRYTPMVAFWLREIEGTVEATTSTRNMSTIRDGLMGSFRSGPLPAAAPGRMSTAAAQLYHSVNSQVDRPRIDLRKSIHVMNIARRAVAINEGAHRYRALTLPH